MNGMQPPIKFSVYLLNPDFMLKKIIKNEKNIFFYRPISGLYMRQHTGKRRKRAVISWVNKQGDYKADRNGRESPRKQMKINIADK